MNPQQALEVSEKLPIVQHDQLNIDACSSLEEQERTVVVDPSNNDNPEQALDRNPQRTVLTVER